MNIGFTIGKFAPLHKRTSISNRKRNKRDGQILCHYLRNKSNANTN